MFPLHCLRRNPDLTEENGKAPIRLSWGQDWALRAHCVRGCSPANSQKCTHLCAPLAAKSCEEALVCARLRANTTQSFSSADND